MAEEKLQFQAEVSRLLDIVAHSLYSEKEVFLRELISNASDACDRLRYAALTQPELTAGDAGFKIRLIADKGARTLTVADNGIGMNREDLVENLGTIARSGTAQFMAGLGAEKKSDVSLIGQFGVGFYSAFMVASEVEVHTRKAGEATGWRWKSDGLGAFTIGEDGSAAPEAAPAHGTRIVLHLREGQDDFLEEIRLRTIVAKYSDHIAVPIVFGDADDAAAINAASALWMRPKSEITAEQYKEFYHHVGHAFDEPWLTLHWRAEGVLEYTGLLFVPSAKPFDLFDPKRHHQVKLYVKRVFITDEAEGLVPAYLRFLRGVVDSEDLPLNISREMLQHNPVLAKIRGGITRRVLGDLAKKAEEDAAGYATFWNNFGAVLKEGLYEDREQKDQLLKLLRARSTAGAELISLADYVGRLKEGQDAIYYITGDDPEQLARSPQLEGFRAKGVEVLLLTDPVDEFWINSVGEYDGKRFKSVTRGGAELSAIKGEEKPDAPKPDAAPAGDIASLIALLKLTLGEAVKDVRASERLTDSAVCLVAAEGDVDMHLERLLKQHRRLDGDAARRVLEINPSHPLIRRLAGKASESGAAESLGDAAFLLLDQARILEGETVPDPIAFARRLAGFVERGL